MYLSTSENASESYSRESAALKITPVKPVRTHAGKMKVKGGLAFPAPKEGVMCPLSIFSHLSYSQLAAPMNAIPLVLRRSLANVL